MIQTAMSGVLGPALALDFENALRRSRIETARYEFKQGLLRLTEAGERDRALVERLAETLTAIANLGPEADGYLFLGVADSKTDADRVQELYGQPAVEIAGRYVVGVDREAERLGQDVEQYVSGFIGSLRASELPEPLKTQLLSSIDVVEYRQRTVIRVRIPRQQAVSFVGEKAFIREGSSTIEVKGGPRLAGLIGLFR